MSERDRPDPLLVAALRRLGAGHDPDTDAIWARVDPARASDPVRGVEPVPVSLDTRRDRALHRTSPDGPRRPRGALAVGLAAAGVLGVLVVSQVVTRPGPGQGPAASGTTSVSSPASAPAPPRTSTPSSSPTTVGPAVGTSAAGSGTRTPSSAGAGTPSTGRSPSSAPAPSRTSAGPGPSVWSPALSKVSGTSLTMTTGTLSDWVVVGGRSDGRQQRANRPVFPSTFLVLPPAGSALGPSPYQLAWSDGVPEQTRSGVRTWQVGTRGGSWTVVVGRADVPRHLLVYAGSAPGGLRLDVSSSTAGTGRWVWSGTPDGDGPFVVGLDVPGGASDVTVRLTPLSRTDGLAVTAVTLQRY